MKFDKKINKMYNNPPMYQNDTKIEWRKLMNKSTRILAMLMAMLMVVAMFAACGGSEDPATTTEATTTEATTEESDTQAPPKEYTVTFKADGTTVGMLFVSKSSAEVSLAVQRSLYPLAIASILAMILAATFCLLYTRKFVSILIKIHRFLTTVSGGNLNAQLDSAILHRNDELGDIGRSALTMQRSLSTLIEQDTLTELFNRRSGLYKLNQVIKKSTEQQTPFCVALGDIDYFKKINDTYGHNCGDIILTKVSAKLRICLNELMVI